MKKLLIIFALIWYAVPVNAQTPTETSFKVYKRVITDEMKTSDVVEVPFAATEIERPQFVVFDKQNKELIGHVVLERSTDTPISITAPVANSTYMIDGKSNTFAQFALPATENGTETITLTGEKPITSSSLTLLLDKNVALPKKVSISTDTQGEVLRESILRSPTITFPKTTAQQWTITFTYVQPLRIAELTLNQINTNATKEYDVRFVAQPSHEYMVFADPDHYIDPVPLEVGNIENAKNVIVANPPLEINPEYIASDSDKDSVPDIIDNCVQIPNQDQVDKNNNGRGDACDDTDQDGVVNAKDNCPNHANIGQADEDGDGMGDVCDGVESRITEQYPWLPWLGIGGALIVLIILFAQAANISSKE